jgi:hypothetical protein
MTPAAAIRPALCGTAGEVAAWALEALASAYGLTDDEVAVVIEAFAQLTTSETLSQLAEASEPAGRHCSRCGCSDAQLPGRLHLGYRYALLKVRRMRPPPNPHELSTWGPECARGIRYADTSTHVPAAGTKGVIRKISTGRKARGSASADLARSQARRPPEPAA